MKPHKPTALLILLACLALLLGCKKDGSAISIEGFYMTDNTGNYIGQHGPADDDWTLKTSLSAREMALFDFPTNTPDEIIGTGEGTIASRVSAYPNPFGDIQTYHVESSLPVVVRLVVVDQDLKVLYKYAIRIENIRNIALPFDDDTFPVGRSFRVYFSFSAEGKPNFKVGYGDIQKCKPNASFPSDCF
jgi:hypothetical protein